MFALQFVIFVLLTLRCVAYSPLGENVVVGFGGSSSHSKCGAFIVLNELDLSIVHEAHDSSICLVMYSPDGETLAVAAEDGAIFLYAVQDDYELIGRCLRHTLPVVSMDFSLDGEWLRSNSAARDLCFFNADDGSYQSNLASMRDVIWATNTCLYTWHTKAIHRCGFLNEKVTGLHTAATSNSTAVLVCGTSMGYLRLHNFPCIPDDSEYHRFPAHVDAVAGIRFAFDSERLLSVGRHDRCIIQWKRHSYPLEEKTAGDYVDLPESEDFALEAREGTDLEDDFMAANSFSTDDLLNAAFSSDSKQLKASPDLDVWLDSVVAPVHPPTQNVNVPDVSLRLEFAYGFKCQDLRNSVRYVQNDHIAFVCGTTGVCMSKTSRAQNFFQVIFSICEI